MDFKQCFESSFQKKLQKAMKAFAGKSLKLLLVLIVPDTLQVVEKKKNVSHVWERLNRLILPEQ